MDNLQAAADALNAALGWIDSNSSAHASSEWVDIYIKEKEGPREIRIPWLPEDISYQSGDAVAATHDILRKGPVDTPLGVGKKELSWNSTFPGARAPELAFLRGTAASPTYYHNILEDWKAKGTTLTVIVTSTPVNFECYVASYKGKFTGAFGNIDYTIKLVEQGDVKVVVTTEEDNADSGTEEGDKTERPAESKESYTIKAGDCMWDIALKFLGDGSRWREIYELNKEALDKAATDMGHSSNDGTVIFPGTTIKLPKK